MSGGAGATGGRTGRIARPLSRRHMPRDHAISLKAYTDDRTARIPAHRGPEQSMRGFDGYANVVDYIVRITHRIWEGGESHEGERDVDYIGACYAPDSIVFDDYGLQRGNAKIIADTHGTTGAFPDIVLDAEDVIWAGDDEIGFHTSHRVSIVGTHTGAGRYDEPTGRRIEVPVIANCVALGNDIFLEHVLYNSSAMLGQLGRDPMEEAARLVADPPAGWPRDRATWEALRRAASPERPLHVAEPVDGFDPDAFARDLHDTLWNGRDHHALERFYADDAPFVGTTGRDFAGHAALAGYLDGLATAFPDLRLVVDEVYWMGDGRDGLSVSTRWSADATHRGDGRYGPATGAPVQIWGITQHEIHDGRVSAEWQLFNELDLMMQIAAARR